MTIKVPPAENLSDNQKGKHASTDESEPTLDIQIEQPYGISTGEELMPSSEDKPYSKKKGIFNNPFHKGMKKDADEVAVATVNTSVETANEHRTPKGFGNFLSRVKQTTSSNNVKDLSEPTTTTVLVEEESVGENEGVHENVTETETPTSTDHTKRQSLLSKFFGHSHKKESVAETLDQELTGTEHHTEEEVVTSTSPPLSRRVTGFFSKKIHFGLDRKLKSSEKIETDGDHVIIVKDTNESPVIVFNDNTTTNNNAPKGVTA
ncbi:uncharacterized protein EV154DRAFT_507571 [Mucor mucedo]|uniref:uncharacterized protein n=1 Tax=Mucor mucedo TaxID=29922 RepID=UPI00221EBE17|nr:uncharacterized protein EV154DRAFT_507571 [Mucor mucedo]KAI7891476.1 hypothetical protein EV154DRAFT_507571 [Mucor mucedo]